MRLHRNGTARRTAPAAWAKVAVGALGAATLAVTAGSAPAGAAPGDTSRVSVSTGGTPGNAASPPDSYLGDEAAITPDGRYVAFVSSASNLAAGDTNARDDVFVHDRDTGATERVSIGSSGEQGDLDASQPSISDDGRYVAFGSRDLGFGGDGISRQAYVRDRQAGTTRWVSEKPPTAGILDVSTGTDPKISGNGRFVTYSTNGLHAFYGAGSGSTLIVVRDLQSGSYTLASRTDGGGVPEDPSVVTNATTSRFSSISADGRYVAFQSGATNLVAGDSNGVEDVFVRDLVAGTTVRASVTSTGAQAGASAADAKLSADGRRVVFSTAAPLVPEDSNTTADVYVHDLDSGVVTLVSATPAGPATAQPAGGSSHVAISPDGGHVAFWSSANDLVPGGDGNINPDLFVRDLARATTQLASVDSSGVNPGGHVHITVGIAHDPALSAHGAVVAFGSRSSGLVPGDTGGLGDVFVHELVPGAVGGSSRFVPLTPARILDTRTGEGAPAAKVAAGGVVDLQVTGRGGVPASGVSAVVLNVTATEADAAGYVTVWPTGQARPNASNLNLERPGQTIPNLVVVPVGTGGQVSLFAQSGVHLLADVAGYFAPAVISGEGRLQPVTPARILDTRTGEGAPAAKVATGGVVDLQVTGRGGVPASGVSAVVLNVTATEADAAGYVTVWPTGQARPNASNLNLERPGQTIPNLVVVPVGTGGQVSLFAQSGVHLLADVAGWFTDATAASAVAGLFVPAAPSRVLDTRDGNGAPVGALGPDGSLDLAVAGRGGLPAAGLGAVVLNVTATGAAAAGYVTAWPAGQARPNASNLNLEAAGQTIPNAAVLPVGAGSAVSLYTQSGTHLIADVSGWFVA